MRQLFRHLNDVEREWQDESARWEFVETFRAGARALWDICPEDRRSLGVTLDMAARRLSPERLTHAQIAALRYCLELLRGAAHEKTTGECHSLLIECGLSPTMAGDDSLAQLYVDEL
jgi:hypothetical protein